MALYQYNSANKSFEPVQVADVITTLAMSDGPWPTYWRPALPTVTKTTVTIPSGLHVMINGKSYTTNAATTLNVSTVGNAAARAGYDVYIYAVEPDVGIVPGFVLSMNSTVPNGYDANTSRKIGGFHCLCADVGTIEGHTLSGYVAGDILPASIWDLLHRPKSEPEGMVYVADVDIWVDIYLASYDGSQLLSVFGGECADGASTVKFHGEKFNEEFAKVRKFNIPRDKFVIAAWGSNNRTAISGAKDWGTTGGHVDTANRRMISNWGVEDACGFMWQWNEWTGGGGTNGWGTNSVYNSAVDPESYGEDYGTLYRLVAGGDWSDSSYCGPRSVSLNAVSANVNAASGGRGASEPRSRFV